YERIPSIATAIFRKHTYVIAPLPKAGRCALCVKILPSWLSGDRCKVTPAQQSHPPYRNPAMTEIETLALRIDGLEMRIAHQDHTIEELSATIADQWKQIEDMT